VCASESPQKISLGNKGIRRLAGSEFDKRPGRQNDSWSQYGTMIGYGVRIIALSTIKAFISRNPAHADAREPLMAWYRQVRGADWATPADVKRAIGSASILNDGHAVFNIAGNKYRIVVWINYHYRVVYVRFIGTHRQYDTIDAQTV